MFKLSVEGTCGELIHTCSIQSKVSRLSIFLHGYLQAIDGTRLVQVFSTSSIFLDSKPRLRRAVTSGSMLQIQISHELLIAVYLKKNVQTLSWIQFSQLWSKICRLQADQ